MINMATLPLKACRNEHHSVFIFSGQKDIGQIPFTLRCIQYMVTHVLQNQQYMFGVRSLLVDEKVLLMKRPSRCVVSATDPAIAAVASLSHTV